MMDRGEIEFWARVAAAMQASPVVAVAVLTGYAANPPKGSFERMAVAMERWDASDPELEAVRKEIRRLGHFLVMAAEG